jgi:hypothetical protein
MLMLLIMIATGLLFADFSSVGRPVNGFVGPLYGVGDGVSEGDGDSGGVVVALGVTEGETVTGGAGSACALYSAV